MSHAITPDKNNSFEDYYKTDNFDNSELQARLYAEIYYDSNVENESSTADIVTTIQFDKTITETNVESVRPQCDLEEQSLVSKTTDSQKMLSTDQTEFNQVSTLASKELNPVCNNKSPEVPSVAQGNKNRKNSSKYKSSKHATNEHQESFKEDHDAAYSKYNVDLKCIKKQKLSAKQIDKNDNNSDSEESIFEVPVPPKPKPLLIDLQDSDEENDINSGIDKNDLILKKWDNITSIKTYSRTRCRNPEIIETSSNHQDISSKNNNTNRIYNNDVIGPNKNIETSTCIDITEDFTEDIVLNCTTVQRGAKSVNEIKQLSKSVETNQGRKLVEDINQNVKKILQNKSKGNSENNVNLHEEISITSRKTQMKSQQNDQSNIYNVSHLDQAKTSGMESGGYTVMDRKRKYKEVDSYPKQKRQCTIQQNDQDVIQGNSNENKRNMSSEYFKPMPEEMRNYYNLSHGQENFDIQELQQGMSKDPRMWAILDEDIMPCPSSKQRTRFWNVRCNNCHQDGHQRYDCSSPRRTSCCYMCGMKGHTESRCPKKMCLTCGKHQNTFRNTCEYCRVLYCTMCNSVGHEPKQCPDLWRRYHQTTDMNSAPQDPGNAMKPSRLLHCCNCAKRGHESSTCREYRWSEHFPTPAVVTNYTDGPTYNPYASSFRSNLETSCLSSEMTGNKTTIPQNITDVQYAITKDVDSADIDTLLSEVNFSDSSTHSQETTCVAQIEGNLKSSPMTNKIFSTVKTKLKQIFIHPVTFISITYSYSSLHNPFPKNHKDARMILKDLSTFFNSRKPMLNSLINRKVAPVFLKTLLDSGIEFEVKIGFTEHQTLLLQLLAMKEYIEYLYDLLQYWLNLSDDEKDYGIDVVLPKNPIKMFNILNSRIPQLEKKYFTCDADYGKNDPRWLYKCIQEEKANLKGGKKYRSRRKCLLRLQTKLLIIFNIEFRPNGHVRTFRDMMKRFESERHQMGEKLDTTTYLRLVLIYNQLFVPHTPDYMCKVLKRSNNKEKKNKKYSLQQEPEITVQEQGNLVYNNTYSSFTSSHTPQDMNLENFSVINNQQNEILIERQIVNDISLETNEITDRNCEIIPTQSFPTHDPQIIPLNIELMSTETENSKRDEDQLLTSEVNIESNIFVNKQNINVNNTMVGTLCLSKKQRKKLRRLHKINQQKNIYDAAFDLIRKARTFKLPHMMNAADEMQRQINNHTIKSKHIDTLSKLILLEEKYRKNVNMYCKDLKK